MPLYFVGDSSRKFLLALIEEELEYLESSTSALDIPDTEEDNKIRALKELREVFSGKE